MYTYDSRDRVSRKVPPVDEDIYYQYNNLGLQTYARYGYDAGRGVRHGYDGFGRLISETNSTWGAAYTVSHQLDADGRTSSVTYPDNQRIHYSYNGIGQLTEIRDGANNLLVTQRYTDLGLPDLRTLANGVTTTLHFDGKNRLQTLTHNFTGVANDVSYNFQYNGASQIKLQHLSNTNYQPRNSTQIQAFSGLKYYNVNGLNQYTSGGLDSHYSYDGNGNLTRLTNNHYTYDGENRLRTASGTTSGTLKYDPLGRLYEYTAGGTTTRFLYDGDAVIAEYNTSGTLLKRYVAAPGSEAPLVSYNGSSTGSANRQFLHANHQGSVIAISNAAGNAVSRNTYDEYGIPTTSNMGRFGYTGQMYLPELKLYHYKARVYAPTIGRFLQTDPVGYEDQMNLYVYVGNDPINMTDPTGMMGYDPQGMAEMRMAFRDPATKTAMKELTRAVREAIKSGDFSKVGVSTEAAAKAVYTAKVEKTKSGRRVGDFTRSQKKCCKT